VGGGWYCEGKRVYQGKKGGGKLVSQKEGKGSKGADRDPFVWMGGRGGRVTLKKSSEDPQKRLKGGRTE